jgi:hypothetical protein
MILMPIVSRMRENDVRAKLAGEHFEGFLYLRELCGKETIPESMNAHSVGGRGTQEFLRASSGFAISLSRGAQDDPAKLRSRASRSEAEDRRTTSDLNVVRMSAKTEHLESLAARAAKTQPQ